MYASMNIWVIIQTLETLYCIQLRLRYYFLSKTGQEHELIESMPLLEWFANNYKKFGATLEIVTDKSQEGSQFVKGFGGIGGEISLRTLLASADSPSCFVRIVTRVS